MRPSLLRAPFALGACLLALLVLTVVPPASFAAAAPDYLEGLGTARRQAVENYAVAIARGDYTPHQNSGGSKYPTEAAERLKSYVRRVPPTAPGAADLHTGTAKLAQRTGLWPKISETAIGVARSNAGRLVLRGSALGVGGYALWQIGCTVGAPFCAKTVTRMTTVPVVANIVEYEWSGPTGRCVVNQTGRSAAPADGVCPASAGSTQGVNWSAPGADIPPNVLHVKYKPTESGTTWYTADHCAPPFNFLRPDPYLTTNSPDTYFPPCVTYRPVNENAYSVAKGAATNARTIGYEEVFCNGAPCEPTRRYRGRYSYNLESFYLDPEIGRILEAPRTTDPEDFASEPADSPSRLKSDAPGAPDLTTFSNALEQWLEADTPEAQAQREAIDFALGQLPPPEDAVWTDETPDVGEVPDSGPAYGGFTMPNCADLTPAACGAQLAALGHTGTRSTTTLSTQAAVLTKPAGAIISHNPPPGAFIVHDAAVTFTANPDPLPVVVPLRQAGEHYLDYQARLNQAGLIGQPYELSVELSDAQLGPNEVVRTDPPAGGRVPPNTVVKVSYNNPMMPPVDAGASACDLPAIPAIDLGPLSVPLGENFPFGAPAWMADFLGSLGVVGQAPRVEIDMPGDIDDLVVDLDRFTPLMNALHPYLLALSFVSMLWAFAAGLAKFGPSDSRTVHH